MKIKTKNREHYGLKMAFPIIGEQTISAEGIIETDNAEAVEILTKKTDDWELVAEEGAGSSVSDNDIKKLSLDELIEVTIEAGYPEEEYKKFKKNQKLMAKYITEKQALAELETESEEEDKEKE